MKKKSYENKVMHVMTENLKTLSRMANPITRTEMRGYNKIDIDLLNLLLFMYSPSAPSMSLEFLDDSIIP